MHVTMKIKITVLTSLFALMFISSCNLMGGNQTTTEDTNPDLKTVLENSDSLRRYLQTQDSLSQGILAKLDTISDVFNKSKEQIEGLERKINDIKAPSRLLTCITFIALILSIISIIVAVVKTRKKVDKWGAIDAARECFKDKFKNIEYRMNETEQDIKKLAKVTSSTNIHERPRSYESHFDEKTMDEMRKKKEGEYWDKKGEPNPKDNDKSSSMPETQMLKHGYAQMHTGKYLVDIVESKQESCVYSLTFTSENTAEFDIISLEKIKTINDLRDVLDLAPGSCLLNEASFHTVERKGECRKIDDNTWEVTKKLVIKVSR